MPNPRLRIDQLPMHRRASAHGAGEGVAYERREVDPDSEELARRTGSTRQAQYASALGFVAEQVGSQVVVDKVFDLSGNWSVGFSVNTGDIIDGSGEWTLLFAGDKAVTTVDGSIRIYLKYDGSTYKVYLKTSQDSGAGTQETSVSTTAGADINILLTKSGTTLTLNVGGSNSDLVLSGTYTLNAAQIELLGTHKITTRAKGTAPVLDNFQVWGSVVTTGTAYGKRTGTGSVYAIQPSDLGGSLVTPTTGSNKTFLHPSLPEISDSKLYYSGFGGALRIPFRSIFERYFQTKTEEVGSQTFAFRLKGHRRFYTDKSERTLVDFGSTENPLCYLTLTTSGNAKLVYGGTTVTSSNTVALDTDFDIFAGCDGTNAFVVLNGTKTTTALGTNAVPILDLERIPDLYIGNDEEPTLTKGFHGYFSAFQFYDYAAQSSTTTATAPILDLDFSSDYIRDKGPNRIAIEKLSHATTEGTVLYADGPLTDQNFTAVQQEVVFGPSAVGYTGKYIAPVTSDASAVRAGDRAYIHSGDYVHVLNSELSQVRPLGIPEPGAEVSCRNVGSGALDGVYQYGYRYQSQDGTYGPMKRLKPLTAFNNTGILIGAGEAEDQRRELGESYGLTDTNDTPTTDEYYIITDGSEVIQDAIDALGDDDEDLSVESYLAFPDFSDLEESVFDRGVTENSFPSGYDHMGIESQTPIICNPNNDFTLQISFKLTVDHTDRTDERLGLFSIGTQKGGGKTRAFMAYLSIDGNDKDGLAGYSDGAVRLVVARSVGQKENRYKYLVFARSAQEGDDSSFWVKNKEYTVVAVKSGDDLKMYVYNKTDGVWGSSTFKNGGDAVGFFPSDGFPNSEYALNFGSVKTEGEGVFKLVSGQQGSITKGSSTTPGHRKAGTVLPLYKTSHIYHARAWTQAWDRSTIEGEINKRFAAVDGAMTYLVKSDVGTFDQDPAINPKKFFDKAASVFWQAYRQDDSDLDKDPPDASMSQVSGSPEEFLGTTITDSGISAIASTQYRVYASSVNDGSIIVSTNARSYIIANKPWDTTSPAATTILLSDVDIDPKNFNWYTNTVNFYAPDADSLQLVVKDLYVNGNKFFDTPLGEFDTDIDLSASKTLNFYLGGFNTTSGNDGKVQIGEFRLWKTDRYDDTLTEAFDFLTGRVSDDEVSNMYAYARFQPSDLVSGNNYSLHPKCALGSSVYYVKTNAEFVDTRQGEGGSETDPAPAIAIPDPPYPWITAVQVFRTEGFIVQDIDSKLEIDQALELVQGQPAYFLARIPSGDSSFIDIAPDDTLGYEAPEGGEGFTPERPNGVCIWQNQLALFRGNTLYFSERGPFGWESFPSWASYAVPTSGSGSDIVGAVEIGSSLLVCGKSWATMLSGAPSQPRPFDLGPGTGAQSARCIAVHGGIAYALGNGKLWRVGQDGGYDDQFSQPVHDILPTQGRVAVVGALSSLLVIDEQSDQVLRFHFPTQAWSIEERDALGVGDQGSDYFVVHQGGSYSKGSAVYGDDVAANTVATSVNATKGSSTTLTNVTADPNIVAGTRILVVDTTGTEVTARVESYAGSTLTVDGDLSSLSGTAQACTIYYGVGQTGMMVDTGWFAVGSRNSDLSLFTDVTSGSFDYSLAGTDTPGDRSNRTGLSFTDLGTAYESTGTGGRGRYVRAVVRNRTAQSASLGHAEVEVKVEQQAS